MDQPESSFKPKILFAPLDWGLGHATRSIPVIKAVLDNGAAVLIAAEGKIKTLLQKEFPQLEFIQLRGYDISYSKSKWTFPFVLASQVPKIISVIKHENIRLQQLVKDHAINGVISDNRFGLHHRSIPCVFITHQLKIKTGLGSQADYYLQRLNYSYVNQFTECWVPDVGGEPNLSGALSHPYKEPAVPVKYLGALSRLKQGEGRSQHILILLSGPEPQRTIFENLIGEQLKTYKGPVVLLRGLPDASATLKLPTNVTVFNHLPLEELQEKFDNATLVISRCGYSTVMDIAATKKKSILVPTPGQTEQQYLAQHLQEQNFALCIEQGKFKLRNAIDLASSFEYKIGDYQLQESLDKNVKDFLLLVKAKMR